MTSTSPSEPWLSILIPAYNVEAYLEECLRSMIEQADPSVEIIVCDDASTDGTLQLSRRIAGERPAMVRVIANETNVGLSATRNRLMGEARGRYWWFVDSDDTLLPGALAAVRGVAERFAPEVIGGNYRKRRIPKFAFSGPANTLLTDRDRIVGGVCKSRKMYAWLKIADRRVWESGLRFPEGKLFEDAAVVPRLVLRARSFYHLRRALIEYRVRPGSVLSGITRTPDRFRTDMHLFLAHALDGFADEMAEYGKGPMPEARFGASHFIAMEFVKICERIEKAGPLGCEVEDVSALARQFRDIMDASSPLPFAELLGAYRKRGRFIARHKLRKAIAFSEGR